MISSIRDDNPVMYLFHKGLLELRWMPSPDEAAVDVPEEPYTLPFGEAKTVKEGKDVTIVTVSRMVYEALWSAKELEKEGISAEIIDLRTLVPLDKKTVINSVKKTGRLLVVDEDYRSYGMTGEIVSLVSEEIGHDLKTPPRRLGYPDVPVPYGGALEKFVLPDKDRIEGTVKEMMK